MIYNLEGITHKNSIPILNEHWKPVGHTTRIVKTENGISGEGLASYPGQARDELIEAMNNGFPFEASMGFRTTKNSITLLKEGQKRTINNRVVEGPMYIAEKGTMYEMSITLSGRDSNTEFKTLNSEVVSLLNSMTKTPDQTPDQTPPTDTKNALPPVPPTPPAPPATPPVIPPQVLNAARNEGYQLFRLSQKYADFADKIDKWVEEGKDAATIENSIKLEKYELSLAHPPAMKDQSSQSSDQVILANFALSCGVTPETLEKKGLDKKVIENADKGYKWGFVETLVNIANSTGGRYTGFSDIELMCKHIKNSAVNPSFKNSGGFSTFNMPNLFERVTEFMLEERWALNPPFALKFCKEESNKDFKKTQRVRPGGGELWEGITNEGKLPHTHFGEESKYESQTDTIGQIVAFDRKTITNDDMGVISSLLEAMVEGALFAPDVQLGKLMLVQAAAAGTFWVNADNSYTGRPLNRANLSTSFVAIKEYLETRGTKSIVQMVNDRWTLITSSSNEETAWEILKQERIVNDTTANTKTGEKNFWYGKMDYAVFPQMSNTSLYGTSTFVDVSTWLLWPSSTKYSPYTINYLRGKKRPTIESIELPGDMLGMGVRGYWDVKINERERLFIMRHKS